MKRTASPSSRAQFREQVEDGRLHGDVQRGGDLVADEQVGARRERAGHRNPLALAARELAWKPAREARRQPHALQQAGDLRPRLRAREAAQHACRPRDLVGDAAARVQRVGRVLEDDLDPPSRFAGSRIARALVAARRRGRSVPPTARASRPRIVQSSSYPSRTRRRARCTRLRRAQRRRPRQRRQSRAGCRERPRAPRRRAGRRRARLVQSRRAAPEAPAPACDATRSSARRDGARWLRARGASISHRATRCGQRGANAQPAGRSPTPTATPGMPCSLPRHEVIRDRRDQPSRIRVPRVREQLGRRAFLDHPARVHHRDAVGDRRDDGQVVGDVDDAEPALCAEAVDLVEDARLGHHVEARRRLVHHYRRRARR